MLHITSESPIVLLSRNEVQKEKKWRELVIAIIDSVVIIVRRSISGFEAYNEGKWGQPVTKVLMHIARCIVPCIILYKHHTTIHATVCIHIMLCIVLYIMLYMYHMAYHAAVCISCCILCCVLCCMCIVLPIMLLYAY